LTHKKIKEIRLKKLDSFIFKVWRSKYIKVLNMNKF